MSNNSAVDVEVRLKLRDGASAGLKQVEAEGVKSAKAVTTATERAAQRAAEAVERSNIRQRSSHEKESHARETLGVRSERAIQKEIEATRRAYATLSAAGFASAQEQERAYAGVQSRVTRLTNEMGKLTDAQKRAAAEARHLGQIEADQERGRKVLRNGAAAVVGAGAAAYTLKSPALDAMSYDKRLAGMANTAFAERDAAGRIMGMKTLEDAVTKARRFGGGTRDQTAEALDTMIASGTVSVSDSIQMLPGIMKAATGSGAGASELATIAIRAKQSFKIAPDDLPGILSAAMAAGQAGGFELKDMAKWLPQQMAMAGNLGLSGKSGFAKLAAWNQASVITSGTKDEGGNNLRDLLMELNTPHFKKYLAEQYLADGKKAKPGEKDKRAKDIDQVFLGYQERGIDKVSATIDIMEKVFAKDKTYQALQAKLKATNPNDKDGRRSIIESMSAQVQGSAVGKVFHNQQSLMAFLGLMNNQDYVKEVLGKTEGEYKAPTDKSAMGTAYEVNASTSSFKLDQAKEDSAAAQKSAMDSLTPAIGKTAEAFSDLAQKNPLLTGSTVLATGAIAAFAATAGLAAIALGGGASGAGAGAIGKYASSAGKLVAGAAGLGLSWEVGQGIGGLMNSGINSLTQWGTGGKSQSLGELIYDKLHSDQPAEQKPLDVNANLQVGLAPGLVLQSQTMESSGGKVYMNTGNMRTGAPG